MQENWHHVHFQSIRVDQPKTLKVGQNIFIQADVCLGSIKPQDVIVEVVYGKVGDKALVDVMLMPMNLKEPVGQDLYRYETNLVLLQGTSGYTLRVRPYSPNFEYPFELPLIKWGDNMSFST